MTVMERYERLTKENKLKADRYIEQLAKLQRYEQKLTGLLHLAALEKKTEAPADEKVFCCSFCGKSQHEVTRLIAAPNVFICDECVDLCNEVLADEK